MKKIIIKYENIKDNFENNLKDFHFFKKEWRGSEKIFVSKLFNFHNFYKKKASLKIALDFRFITSFEIPSILDLKNIEYIFIDKNTHKEDLIKKNKRLIYSFEDFSFQKEKNIKKELQKILDRKLFESDLKFSKFLKNIFLEIPLKSSLEEKIFKEVVFIKKILVDIIGLKDSKKIKIILRNNFTQEKNQEILESKLLSIDGIILN